MKNPTLLTLLKMGCSVEFPSGYKLTGDTENHDINLSTPFGADGFYGMTIEGLAQSLIDEAHYRRESKTPK
jgi:hypothetical protein